MDAMAIAERDALERARRIHAEHIVIDSLAPTFTSEMMLTPAMEDLVRTLQAEGRTRSVIRAALAEQLIEGAATNPEIREAYLAYWQRSGVTAGSCTLYGSGPPSQAWDTTLTGLSRGNRLIRALGGAMIVAESAAEIEEAHRTQRHAVIYNLQNAEPIGEQLDRADVLYGLGLRIVQLTYNLRNRFGDGCTERYDAGLSRFGEALVEKLNQRRLLVDVSHCGDQTTLDAIHASRVPVACTHASARAISQHARGKTDAVLRALAERGGYIGVLIVPFFLMPAQGDGGAPRPGLPSGWATLDTVVDHVVHVLNIAGSDSVGIGTDWGKPYYSVVTWSAGMVRERAAGFDWVGWRPEDRFDPNMQTHGMETWDLWPNLTAAMLRRGIPEGTVVKIVGGNFLRVFREVCG